jgi:neurotransmitter:Na+ symporter, NSS family
LLGLAAMALSVPSAMSSIEGSIFNSMSISFLGNTKIGFFDIMDFTFGTVAVVIICLMLSLYTGWAKKIADFADEIATGSPGFTGGVRKTWIFFIKWVCPIVIALVLLDLLGVFGTPQEGG